MIKLDSYSIKARVYPAFIVLLPLLILALFYITDFKVYYHYLTAIISVGFLSFILAQLGRDQGKNKEIQLFESMGGKPTIQILRHTNNHLDKTTKARYHKGLSEKIQEINIPSHEDKQLTTKIKEGGRFLDISLLDHLILNPSGEYFSFTDEGILEC